jgi:hypothetical protein
MEREQTILSIADTIMGATAVADSISLHTVTPQIKVSSQMQATTNAAEVAL